MPRGERWLRSVQAARLIANALKVSLGAALPILREAMASGEVRLRCVADGKPKYLSPDLWTNAEFDLEQNVVSAHDQWALDRGLDGVRQYQGLEISTDDLRYWLIKNHESVRCEHGIGSRGSGRAKPAESEAGNATHSTPTPLLPRQTKRAAASEFLTQTYPEGIPPGMSDKELARKYVACTGVQISPRTLRRARTGRQ